MAARSLSLLPVATKSIAPLSPPSNPRAALRLRSSLFAAPIFLAPSPVFPLPIRRSHAAVVFMLPTAKPERASAEKKPSNGGGITWDRWSSRAIKSFGMAELEARKLKYPNTGTEALLMGILVEGTSEAAKFLRANGISLFKVREETVKLLGKSDMFVFSPEHPPLTDPAQRALDWAVDEKLKSGEDGEITTTHMLLGIWSEKESAGYKILASLGFDDQKATELAKSANKDFAMNHR
ncbi:ATP-dependent Clp protease ATP-binding subunit CLPT1, chloroplastic isoform X2 [Canna indica]|uniref:ATP-dependent Clp protease ATP-binding subunit CLPT1, chloroplastic isoform X2 n=1 Tax=Canna indica TaxID=4628 RepID=A0AAQ3QEC5_9LILI|nr:ATP-dependent Clp protease ATP-binding subunit CLPT1, chloroplastic isoform X2 [Canna indica]